METTVFTRLTLPGAKYVVRYNTVLKDNFIIAYPSAPRSCKLLFCLKIAHPKYYIYGMSNPHVDHMTRHIIILSS